MDKVINTETGEIMSTDSTSLYKKLSQIMAELEHIPQRGYNAFHNYQYTTAEDVINAVRMALIKHNIVFIPSLDEVRQNGDKTLSIFNFMFVDSETGATIVHKWAGEGADKLDKGFAKSATNGVKYYLMKFFLIASGDDVDPDASPPPTKTQAPTVEIDPGKMIIGLPKAKELTGKDRPTIQEIASIGESGIKYLQWVADNITDKPFGKATRKFLDARSKTMAQPATSSVDGNDGINNPNALVEYAKDQGKVYAGAALLFADLGIRRWPDADDTEAWVALKVLVDKLENPS